MQLYTALNNDEHTITLEQFGEILNAGDFIIRKFIVGKHSLLDGVLLKNSNIPVNILIGPLVREKEIILADGNTILRNNDILVLVGKKDDIEIFKNQLKEITVFKRAKNFINKLFRKKSLK